MDLIVFKNYISKISKSFKKRSFNKKFIFSALLNDEFFGDVNMFIEKLSHNYSSVVLDSIFSSIRKKTMDFFVLAANENSDKKVDYALISLAYYYLLESFDEYSCFSDNIIEEIKKCYGDDYIKIISTVDKMFLSVDNKDKFSEQEQLELNDLLNKYVVLKKWQDDQHYFFIKNNYWKDIEKILVMYNQISNLKPYELEYEVLKKRVIEKMTSQNVLSLNTCSILSLLDIKNDLLKIIGGKMYGLAVLNSYGIKVPYTCVIPINSNFSLDDISLIDNKYQHYSVRSSADIEDGENNSFAGMFDSYLNVSLNDIFEKYNLVKKSLNNQRLKKYVELNKTLNPNMAVIIQSYQEPSYAGVWIGNSLESGILEWVNGNGEKLVSGSKTPQTEVWNEGNFQENSLTVNNEYVGKMLIKYQKIIGTNADFEWMILNNELIMLQYRPVTKSVNLNLNQDDKQYNNQIQGIAASPGVVVSKAQYLSSFNDNLEENKILLAKMTDPDWIPQLLKSCGAITANGGFLCHTAIICRELGIPCVTGVGNEAFNMLCNVDGDMELNGTRGIVTSLEYKRNR